jgi:hypothetical protein
MSYDLTDIVHDIHPIPFIVGDETVSLTGADKAVLYELAHRADKDTHACYAGHLAIALPAHISRHQVIDSIAKLDKIGVFKSIIPPYGEGNPRRTNLYTLDVEHLTGLATLSQPRLRKRVEHLMGLATLSQPAKKEKTIKLNGKKYKENPPSLNGDFCSAPSDQVFNPEEEELYDLSRPGLLSRLDLPQQVLDAYAEERELA